MMADPEIASFLTKFKFLCNAGVNASLNISSCHGKATVTLQADLGPLSKPSIIPQSPHHRDLQTETKYTKEFIYFQKSLNFFLRFLLLAIFFLLDLCGLHHILSISFKQESIFNHRASPNRFSDST